MENVKKRLVEAEIQYNQVKEDNDKIEEMIEFLKAAPKNLEPLKKYYFKQWLEDYTDANEINFYNDITNEDAIFDEIGRQYELYKEIILICAEYINKK